VSMDACLSSKAQEEEIVTDKKRLLLCVGNSCRSQMAEGLLRDVAPEKYDVHRASGPPASRCYRTVTGRALPLVAGPCEKHTVGVAVVLPHPVRLRGSTTTAAPTMAECFPES